MDYQLKDGISLTGIENDDVNAGLVEKLEAELVLVASRDGGADVQLKDEAQYLLKLWLMLRRLSTTSRCRFESGWR